MAPTFRVWCETGDLIAQDIRTRDAARTRMGEALAEHVEQTGCDDEDCGVLHPHGFFYDAVENGQVLGPGCSD